MRVLTIGAIVALAALSVVKVHLVRAESGARETRLVVQQPFSMPIDSADAFCMRRLSAPIYQCAMQFVGEHQSAIKLATLPFCAACASISRAASEAGRDRAAVKQRDEDFQALAGMAFDKP